MTLCALSLQPLDYVKGYAEALSEIEVWDDTEPDIMSALTKCLDARHDTNSMLPHAADLATKEHDMGRVQAFVECAEAYRQLGEIYGWDWSPNLEGLISWRLRMAQGLIDKA